MTIYATAILKKKKEEVVKEMADMTRTPTQRLASTMMYDDLVESIAILDKAFFARNTEGGNP